MSRNPELESIIESKAAKDPGFALAYAVLKLTDTVFGVGSAIEHHSIENSAALRKLADAAGVISLVCPANEEDG